MAESARREVERCRDLADVFFTSPPPEQKRAEPLLDPPRHSPPDFNDEPWHKYRVRAMAGGEWWTWECGIIDLRVFFKSMAASAQQSEGVQLRLAAKRVNWVRAERACAFKIGIASDLANRWDMYQSSDWVPSYLFIVEVRLNAARPQGSLKPH